MSSVPMITLSQLGFIGPVILMVAGALLLLIGEAICRSTRGKVGLGQNISMIITLIVTAAAGVNTLFIWRKLAEDKTFFSLFTAQGAPTGAGGELTPSWTAGALKIDFLSLFVIALVVGVVIIKSYS